MFKHIWPYSLLMILVFGLGAFFALIYHEPPPELSEEIAMGDPRIFSPAKQAPRDLVLVDPEMAPPEVLEEVMRGYWILIDTQKYAKEYAGDRLNCRNCHFQAGNTLGGKNGSISLVGVSHIYPRYSERAGRKISLAERINNCFERSLNGKPLPLDGPEMRGILAYLEWISSPVKNYREFPWLGLPQIVKEYRPNRANGEKQYQKHCAACHKADGRGTSLPVEEQVLDIPPLWGPESFNDGAGMNRISMFAPFIWLNMPYMEPVLTEEEAMDIADYVTGQPRPKFIPKQQGESVFDKEKS